MNMLEMFFVCYFGIHFSILFSIYLRILSQWVVWGLQQYPSMWIQKKQISDVSSSCLICLETINSPYVYQCYCKKTCSFACHFLCMKNYLRYELKCPICRQFLMKSRYERMERWDLLPDHEPR